MTPSGVWQLLSLPVCVCLSTFHSPLQSSIIIATTTDWRGLSQQSLRAVINYELVRQFDRRRGPGAIREAMWSPVGRLPLRHASLRRRRRRRLPDRAPASEAEDVDLAPGQRRPSNYRLAAARRLMAGASVVSLSHFDHFYHFFLGEKHHPHHDIIVSIVGNHLLFNTMR